MVETSLIVYKYVWLNCIKIKQEHFWWYNQAFPTSETLQNYQGIGVPDESLAVILQRGGDELLLSKADDRFIVPLPMLVGMR